MVATTFAADTPLAVAGLVAKYGVAGNWLWWNGAFSGVLTVFFFSRLWRRAGVLTDVEFAELRYGGRPAAVLRGFRALYLAIPDQPHHHGLGDPRDGHHPPDQPQHRSLEGRHLPVRRDRAVQRVRRPLGRHRHRPVPVRLRHGRLHPAGGARRAVGRRARGADGEGRRALRLDRGGVRRDPAARRPVAPAHDPARLARRPVVGGLVSRARSRAAAGTWCSAFSPPRTSATACSRPSGSPSRTTRCGPGPGSWSASSA